MMEEIAVGRFVFLFVEAGLGAAGFVFECSLHAVEGANVQSRTLCSEGSKNLHLWHVFQRPMPHPLVHVTSSVPCCYSLSFFAVHVLRLGLQAEIATV